MNYDLKVKNSDQFKQKGNPTSRDFDIMTANISLSSDDENNESIKDKG